jgi:hypothetical protein
MLRLIFTTLLCVPLALLLALPPTDKEGQEIVVANVERDSLPGKISRIEVDASRQRMKAYGEGDKLVAIYPATIGSDDRPSPKGEFKVTKITEDPVYHYDPALHLPGVHVHEKLDIPPGPNNPVGAVWIDLSAEGYGIHGSPDPDKISKSASHGCIRLTNWDALELARHLRKGIPVVIEEGEKTGALERSRQDSQQLAATELTPLPGRNPVRGGRPTVETPLAPSQMATIPWTETEIAASKAKCREALSSLALDYEPLPHARIPAKSPRSSILRVPCTGVSVMVSIKLRISFKASRPVSGWRSKGSSLSTLSR